MYQEGLVPGDNMGLIAVEERTPMALTQMANLGEKQQQCRSRSCAGDPTKRGAHAVERDLLAQMDQPGDARDEFPCLDRLGEVHVEAG